MEHSKDISTIPITERKHGYIILTVISPCRNYQGEIEIRNGERNKKFFFLITDFNHPMNKYELMVFSDREHARLEAECEVVYRYSLTEGYGIHDLSDKGFSAFQAKLLPAVHILATHLIFTSFDLPDNERHSIANLFSQQTFDELKRLTGTHPQNLI
ncbi:MAG: hypothetical protein WCV79_02340 [Candidatus Paceibacterota bacterium]|jgi:hypothetical protein